MDADSTAVTAGTLEPALLRLRFDVRRLYRFGAAAMSNVQNPILCLTRWTLQRYRGASIHFMEIAMLTSPSATGVHQVDEDVDQKIINYIHASSWTLFFAQHRLKRPFQDQCVD